MGRMGRWIPAFAGMTKGGGCRNDEGEGVGMTEGVLGWGVWVGGMGSARGWWMVI